MMIKVNRQPYAPKSSAIVGAAIIEPIPAPALKIPCARARSLTGNHSALFFTAPGQLPASATPNSPLNIPREAAPLAKK